LPATAGANADATVEAELPPSRAAPECGKPERSNTPRKHAAVTVRSSYGHLSPQHHKGMGLRNSDGMLRPPSRHEDDDDDVAPGWTWKAGKSRQQPSQMGK
jgi:hypothetical protein